MRPTEVPKLSVLMRLILGIAVAVLPVLAWVDYQQGYRFSALVELIAAVTLLSLVLTIRLLGPERASRWTLVVVFALAALGSVQKLDSTPNFAWFTVMPFLYISLGGLRLGGTLSAAHFLFITICYLTIGRDVVAAIGVGTLLQVALAYLTAAGLAFSYERVQRGLRRQLRTLAEHDPLTGLLNRRGMEKRLKELTEFLRRHDVAVTLAVLDIDHFKNVNDRHGHDTGDRVLQHLGEVLRRAFRSSDYLSRWGGDEFLVALTRTGISDARSVLERLRSEIAASTDLPEVSLSIGAAEWRPGTDLSSALKQADMALYEAKESGRNVLVAAPEESPLLSAVQ
ncbi:MAG: diguanylate cyclase [Pseudomonadales bacterium]